METRFFAPPPLSLGPFDLTGDEARHIAKSLRMQVGQSLTLFDGSGREFTARIVAISGSRVRVEVEAAVEVDREPATSLTLAVALPKGDRQRVLVEKLTELGATRLIPLESARSVALPTSGAIERLQRWVIEASKQCGRTRLLEIAAPRGLSELFEQDSMAPEVWMFDPSGRPPASGAGLPRLAVIGPEGGWTTDELARADAAGWRIVGLGPRILRVETAAIAVASRIVWG